MKTLLMLLGLGAVAARPEVTLAQERAELTTPPHGDNQRAEVSQWIGLVKVTIA